MDDFYNLSLDEILEILKTTVNCLKKQIDDIKNENTKAKQHARSKSLAKSIAVIEDIFEKLHIIIDDDYENITVEDEYYDLTHQEIIKIIYDALLNQEAIIDDIETQMSIDPKSTALRNEIHRALDLRDIIIDMISDFNIEMCDFREHAKYLLSI